MAGPLGLLWKVMPLIEMEKAVKEKNYEKRLWAYLDILILKSPLEIHFRSREGLELIMYRFDMIEIYLSEQKNYYTGR